MSITTLYKKLTKNGYDAEIVNIWSGEGTACPGIMVKHNYYGLYPTKRALDIHAAVANIARRAGFQAERRGCCTGTLIY